MPTIAPLDLDGHCVTAAFLDDFPFFALADGSVHWLDHGHKSVTVHDGMLCCEAESGATSLLTGGEDGRIARLSADGKVQELAREPGKWINAISSGPRQTVAYATGRKTIVLHADGKQTEYEEQRTVEGLAFAPKGLRVAAARYDGVSLHWAARDAQPVNLDWKGAHFAVTFSPDGNYVVSSMQENALHGWRLKDGKHMRMTGYQAKVKSLSWANKGKWLASSGAPAAIVWPFAGKDGPMGKAPIELGHRDDSVVTKVACHPTEEVVAAGYADGMILAIRISDQKAIHLRSSGQGAISSLDWSRKGLQLAYGSEAGDCGLVDITA